MTIPFAQLVQEHKDTSKQFTNLDNNENFSTNPNYLQTNNISGLQQEEDTNKQLQITNPQPNKLQTLHPSSLGPLVTPQLAGVWFLDYCVLSLSVSVIIVSALTSSLNFSLFYYCSSIFLNSGLCDV